MINHSPWQSDWMQQRLRSHPIAWALMGIAIVLLSWFVVPIWLTYINLDRIASDPDAAVETLNSIADEGAAVSGEEPTENTRPLPIEGTTRFLLIGTDDRSRLDDLSSFGDFEGRRADVIIVASMTPETNRVRLISLPRDLLAPDLCGDFDEVRLADTFEGCTGVGGETLLQLTVEQVTGLTIDHIATIDLRGFQDLVDELGGYEICLEHDVRDPASGLSLPAGCNQASGSETLAWIRSRKTEELIDGRWRTVPLANDLIRNERERDFLIDMLDRVIDATNVLQLQSLASTIAPHVSLDDSLDIGRLVQTAWSMRLLTRDRIETVAIPVSDETLRDMAVLRATVDVPDFLAE